MIEAERLSALIGEIYDAVLDQVLWPRVLAKVSAFVGGVSSALYAKDATRKTLEVYHQDDGIDPRYVRSYFDVYAKFDPTTTAHFFAEIGQVVTISDIMPWEEFLDTRFYREWVKPQGLSDSVNAVLDKSATSVALFGVFLGGDKPASAEALRRMNLILPHMRRAVLIGRVIEFKTAEAAAFGDVFNGLRAASFLVNAAGAVVHANNAGHAMLRGGRVLREAGGRLAAAADPVADAALLDVFGKAASGDAAVGITGISIPLLLPSGDNHVAHILPLTSGARARSGAPHSAVAALFVHRAELATPSLPESVAKAYRLTPTELRVLLAIVEAGGVAETAETLGVAETTVKTHLHRIFAKTGTGRQAELVKLVAGFTSPIAG